MNKISYNKRNSEKHHRRSIRLREYDYSQAGGYFVTICTRNSEYIFGKVVNGVMKLNKYGHVVEEEWRKTARLRKDVKIDVFMVMPNHFHGIVMINEDCRGTARRAPIVELFGKPVIGSLPTIIRSFKSAVAKQINIIHNSPGISVWQRNYYEHVIRNENELNLIRQYILYNPLQWQYDRENPEHIPNKNYENQWGDFEEIIYSKTITEQTGCLFHRQKTGKSNIPV